MLHLVGNHAETKHMLKLSNTPRLAWEEILMAGLEQQQIRHHGYAKGLRDQQFPLSLQAQ
jgi:hypothetical protein